MSFARYSVFATPANSLAAIVVTLAWAAFGVRVVMLRLANPTSAETPQRRDRSSWWGILLQSLAIGIAMFGTFHAQSLRFDAATLGAAALPIVLALGGLLLFDSAARELGRNWSLVARVREDHALVTTGPFAFVRNPIYLAMLLMTIAAGIALGHLMQLIAAVPLFIVATAIRVASEERLLRAQFGSAYDNYAAKVARLIPGTW